MICFLSRINKTSFSFALKDVEGKDKDFFVDFYKFKLQYLPVTHCISFNLQMQKNYFFIKYESVITGVFVHDMPIFCTCQ